MATESRLEKIKKVVAGRQSGLILVVEDVHDPHNAAAILRSADAFGVQKVYFIFKTVKKYNPAKVGKVSSASANKWLDFEIFNSTEECFSKLKKDKYKIYITLLAKDAKLITKVNFKQKKLAVVIGNEHAGVSPEAIKLADEKIIIPMSGFVQSLNVSVSGAITLYEVFRQRKDKFLLNEKEQNELINKFLKK